MTRPDEPELRATFQSWMKARDGDLATALERDPPAPVSLSVLSLHEPSAEDALLDSPSDTLELAREVLAKYRPDLAPDEIEIRPTDLPHTRTRSPGTVRGDDVGHLVAVEGTVLHTADPRPVGAPAVWRCARCGAEIEKHGEGEPAECFEAQNGCGRRTTWKLVPDASIFEDVQRIDLVDLSEARGDPVTLVARLTCGLVGTVATGDRVRVTGILDVDQRRDGAKYRLAARNVQALTRVDIELDDDDRDRLRSIVEDLDMPAAAVASLAPGLVDLPKEKLAVLLALATTPRDDDAAAAPRGVAHLLLVGDPATSKSTLLGAAADLAPFAERATGPTATGPGLTATTERSQHGSWRTRPGALPRADGGVLVIDELGRLAEEHRDHLHESLADGRVTVSKAGGTVTWPARCSCLAAMNPEGDRLSPEGSIAAQTDLPQSLLDRFDLVLPIVDEPDTDRDPEIAGAVIDRLDAPSHNPPLDEETLRELLVLGREIEPELSGGARETASTWWTERRNNGSPWGTFLTPRDLEAVIRLARGAARLRLSETVREEDVWIAVDLVEKYAGNRGADAVSDLARRVAEVVDHHGGEWIATATEIADAAYQDKADPPGPSEIGKRIAAAEARGEWRRQGITHEKNTSGDSRDHSFIRETSNGRGV